VVVPPRDFNSSRLGGLGWQGQMTLLPTFFLLVCLLLACNSRRWGSQIYRNILPWLAEELVDTFCQQRLNLLFVWDLYRHPLFHEYWIYSTPTCTNENPLFSVLRHKDTIGFATARARRCDIPLF